MNTTTMNFAEMMALVRRCRRENVMGISTIGILVECMRREELPADSPGARPATMTDLSRACGVSTAAITIAVDVLSAKANPRIAVGMVPLVERESSDVDRRRIRVRLTEAGRALFRSAEAAVPLPESSRA